MPDGKNPTEPLKNRSVLSSDYIAGFASAGGFSGKALTTSTAIAIAESSGQTNAVGGPNSNGSFDYGLFQINDIHNPTDTQKWDPLANSKLAVKIYRDAGGKFTPWATFNSQKGKAPSYLAHVDEAKVGIAKWNATPTDTKQQIINNHGNYAQGVVPAGLKGESGPIIPNPLDGISGAISGFSATVAKVASNIGIVIVAVILIILGFVILTRNQVGAVVSAATPIGKVAKVAKAVG